MLLGLIVMYAIGPQRAHVLNQAYNTDNYSSTYFFLKQAVSLLLSLAAFTIFAKAPLSFIQKHARTLVVIALAACAVLAVAGALKLGIAQCSLGACRWFDLGPLGSVQPAEFLKFALLLMMAGLLGSRFNENKVSDREVTLVPVGILMAVIIFFVIYLQKDMGTGIALIAIVIAMFTTAGINKRVGMILLGGIAALGVLLIIIAPHRMERIATFFAGDNTSASSDAENYHITHAKIAIGSGGLTGVGIGNSVQATGYLPEVINDSVFAVMGETFGFVGLTTILVIFAALLLRLLTIADHLENMSMRLIVIGVFGWLGSHVLLNIAAMTGLAPLTGITLPLLSFGGTSMVFIAGALGLVFQLSRYTINETKLERVYNEDSRSRRGIGRTRHTNRSRA